jgi:hypothetical protein
MILNGTYCLFSNEAAPRLFNCDDDEEAIGFANDLVEAGHTNVQLEVSEDSRWWPIKI